MTYKHSEVLYAKVPIRPLFVPEKFTPDLVLRRMSALRLLCMRMNMVMALKLMTLTLDQFERIGFKFFDKIGIDIMENSLKMAAMYLTKGMFSCAVEEIEKIVEIARDCNNLMEEFGWGKKVDENIMEANGVLCIMSPFMVIGY